MTKRRVWIAAVAMGAALSASPTSARTSGVSLQDRQQAACYGDVQKLCGQFVPDVAKTEACMKGKKAMVSKKCADMWDVTE